MKVFKVALAALICLALALSISYTWVQARYFPQKYMAAVEKADYSDKALIFAVIRAESGFDENAKSDKGAIGLMQLMPKTAEYVKAIYSLPEGELTDGEYNIVVGGSYLKYLSGRFWGVQTIAAAYNAGEGRVKEWLKDKRFSADGITLDAAPLSETNAYVRRIKNFYKFYRFLLKNT